MPFQCGVLVWRSHAAFWRGVLEFHAGTGVLSGPVFRVQIQVSAPTKFVVIIVQLQMGVSPRDGWWEAVGARKQSSPWTLVGGVPF